MWKRKIKKKVDKTNQNVSDKTSKDYETIQGGPKK